MFTISDKQKATNAKIRAATAKRPQSIRKLANIAKIIELFESGQVVSEDKLPNEVDRMTMKSHIKFIKDTTDLDIITINRGRATIGWMLAEYLP